MSKSAAARHREHDDSDAAEERAARHIEIEAIFVEKEAETIARETADYARALIAEEMIEEVEDLLEAERLNTKDKAEGKARHAHVPKDKAAAHTEAEARAVEEEAKAFAQKTIHRAKDLRKKLKKKRRADADRADYDAEGRAVEEEAKAFSSRISKGPDDAADAALSQEGKATEKEATGLELDVLDFELERMNASKTLIDAVETFVEADDEKADESDEAEKPDDSRAAGAISDDEPPADAGAGPAPERKKAPKSRPARPRKS